ncbi:hypothetical protein Deima_2016 [Deinococcus maricopensis DSM 21211]|uniref:Uncharacterized protein n=2 Tax=Deinococcus TaxID=1298 RepID=E8U9C1_DEIML|nr:hypothetical protein Deima_2016 [Deinococcus maricopensis DSM 21211]
MTFSPPVPASTDALRRTYIETLQDLHRTEQALLDALCAWCSAATESTRALFARRLEHTRAQAIRLGGLLHRLDAPLDAGACAAVHAELQAARDAVRGCPRGARRDTLLLNTAERLKLHQLRQYEAACRYALILNDEEAFGVLMLALADERTSEYIVQYLSDGDWPGDPAH